MNVTGAVEGDLDEAVLRRLCEENGIQLGVVHGRKGKTGLLQNIAGYNNAARFSAWVVVVDLDSDCDCAVPCLNRWLPQPSSNMRLRIAVRAIEAWLLSDRERIASFLGISAALVPRNPETLDDPKRELIELARRSRRREIRDNLVPKPDSGRRIGPLYTSFLIRFTQDRAAGWRPEEAANFSESLARCIRALSRLAKSAG